MHLRALRIGGERGRGENGGNIARTIGGHGHGWLGETVGNIERSTDGIGSKHETGGASTGANTAATSSAGVVRVIAVVTLASMTVGIVDVDETRFGFVDDVFEIVVLFHARVGVRGADMNASIVIVKSAN